MKKFAVHALLAAAFLLPPPLLWGGTVKGKVVLEPREGVRLPGAASQGGGRDPYGGSGGKKTPPLVDYNDRSEVVVYIEEAPGRFPPLASNPVLNQQNTSFMPRVLPVLAGSTVDFPNNDNIFHNVFSFSDAKNFDLGLYPKGQSKSLTFDKPGVVRLYCSIHSEMSAVILVLQNPYFAMAKKGGEFAIEGVPAGNYTLVAWHERFPPARADVAVPAEGTVEADLRLGVKNLPVVK
jgi:plastocyanin